MTVAAPVSTQDVQRAAAELARMRGSLAGWMRVRLQNDRVLAGQVSTRKPLAYAQRVIAAGRDMAIEQDLAGKLYALLTVVMPGYPLPDPDLSTNPSAAVQLAKLALSGGRSVSGPVPTSGLLTGGAPWLWPVLIVGAVLLTVTTAIKTAADIAKDREEKACIEAGACTDYGFWLKAGGVAVLAYLAWEKFGGRKLLKERG